jgi:hypothetical protein
MKISKEQIESLRPYISNIDALSANETDDELLEELDKLLILDLEDNGYALSSDGIKLQLLRDAIFEMNE